MDFKAALRGYLDEINIKAGRRIIQTQMNATPLGATELEGA